MLRTSALGESLPIHSAPVPTNDRYAFDSCRIIAARRNDVPEADAWPNWSEVRASGA